MLCVLIRVYYAPYVLSAQRIYMSAGLKIDFLPPPLHWPNTVFRISNGQHQSPATTLTKHQTHNIHQYSLSAPEFSLKVEKSEFYRHSNHFGTQGPYMWERVCPQIRKPVWSQPHSLAESLQYFDVTYSPHTSKWWIRYGPWYMINCWVLELLRGFLRGSL